MVACVSNFLDEENFFWTCRSPAFSTMSVAWLIGQFLVFWGIIYALVFVLEHFSLVLCDEANVCCTGSLCADLEYS